MSKSSKPFRIKDFEIMRNHPGSPTLYLWYIIEAQKYN